jgi:hypothetical protein
VAAVGSGARLFSVAGGFTKAAQRRTDTPTSLGEIPYTARRSEATGWQVLCTVPHSGPRARYSDPHRASDAQAFAADIRLPSWSRSGSALAGSRPSWVAGPQRFSGALMFISIGIVFAVATLVATGMLFMVQIFEDFRSV